MVMRLKSFNFELTIIEFIKYGNSKNKTKLERRCAF